MALTKLLQTGIRDILYKEIEYFNGEDIKIDDSQLQPFLDNNFSVEIDMTLRTKYHQYEEDFKHDLIYFNLRHIRIYDINTDEFFDIDISYFSDYICRIISSETNIPIKDLKFEIAHV